MLPEIESCGIVVTFSGRNAGVFPLQSGRSIRRKRHLTLVGGSKGTKMNTRNYLQTILGILLMGCAFSASSQDYWVDIGSVEAEEQDGVVLVPVRINKITDQGFTVPGEVGSGDNVRVWYASSPYKGYAFDRNNTGTSNRPEIDTVSGEDYEEKSGWIRFRAGRLGKVHFHNPD